MLSGGGSYDSFINGWVAFHLKQVDALFFSEKGNASRRLILKSPKVYFNAQPPKLFSSRDLNNHCNDIAFVSHRIRIVSTV